MNSPMLRIAIAAGTALFLAIPLWAQAAPDSVKLRNNCRLAEQVLTTGHPAPKIAWARTFLANCQPEQWAGASAAVLDRLRTSTDAQALTIEWGSVSMLRDARLLTLAKSIALDN